MIKRVGYGVFVVVVACWLVWMVQQEQPRDRDDFPRSLKGLPDLQIESGDLVVYDEIGALALRVAGNELNLFERMGRVVVRNPRVTVFQSGRTDWDFNANHAIIQNDVRSQEGIVSFSGGVEFQRGEALFSTTDLSYGSRTNTVQSDTIVVISSNSGSLYGEGFRLSLDTGEFEFNSFAPMQTEIRLSN